MKNKLLSCLLVFLLLLSGLFGCVKQPNSLFLYDSKSKIELLVPRNENDTYFSFQVFRVYDSVSFEHFGEIEESYTVGDDAFFTGSKIENLNGTHIDVSYYSLDDFVADNDYKAYIIGEIQKGVAYYHDSDVDEKSRLYKNALVKIDDVYTSCKVMVLNISFEGGINDNIEVDSLIIPNLNFEYAFDEFNINLVNIPDEISVANSDLIVLEPQFSGVRVGMRTREVEQAMGLSNEHAATDILSIKCVQTVDDVLLVTEENFYDNQLRLIANGVPDISFRDYSFKKDDDLLRFELYYMNSEDIETYDDVVQTFVYEIDTIEYGKVWYFSNEVFFTGVEFSAFRLINAGV